MSDLRATREQPPDPEPARLHSENGYPITAAVSLTALAVTSLIDGLTRLEVPRGVYAGLAGLFVVGFAGWLVRSAQRMVGAEVQQLRAEVAELRKELRATPRGSAQWSPPWGQAAAGGHMYVSQTSVDTVPLQAHIAPDAAAALQRIGLRLLPGGDEQ